VEFDILIASDALDADFASRDTGTEIEAFGTWIVMGAWRIVISPSQRACNNVSCLVLLKLSSLSFELDVADS